MAKPKAKTLGEEIIEGLENAIAFSRGDVSKGRLAKVPGVVDVKKLRRKLGMSQDVFAAKPSVPTSMRHFRFA